MDRKMTLASSGKRVPSVQQKGKVTKPKTIGSKVKPKGVTTKRTKPGTTKVKGKPAPHVEPGYSLYSVTSDDSVTKDNDTSMEVLRLLRESKKEGKIKGKDAMKIPFNNRLSSSTPDPERLSLEKNVGETCQMIPERDTSSSLWKDTLLKGTYHLPTQVISNQPNSQFSMMPPFAFYSDGAAGLRNNNFPQNVGISQFPAGNDGFYDSHRNYYRIDGNTPVLTFSQGFVPTQDTIPIRGENYEIGRESDPDALLAYIQRESTGFVPVQSFPERENRGQNEASDIKDKSSSSKGVSTITPDTSRSGYVTLPQPQGNQKNTPHPNTKAVLSNENGLYQIRAQNNFPDQNKNFERYMTGQSIYPTPALNSSSVKTKSTDGKTVSTDGSYLLNSEVPEKDSTTSESHFPPVVPVLELQETLSSINGSDLHEVETPRSSRSVGTSSGTPKSQATPKNSSSSNSSKSVHFSLQKESANESSNNGDHSSVKGNSLRTCETQTDSVNTDNITMHSGTSGQGVKTNVLIPTGQGHFIIGQGELQQLPANLQMTGAFLQQTGMSDHSAGQSSSGVSSAVPNPWSQVKTDAGLKKLRYFLKELKECGKINKDVEIARLVKEIEKTLETIPQLKSTFSLHAEIDLAIQPLRNENAQLRRRLRLLGQYTKEAESEKDKGPSQSQIDFETLQLQASNTALKRQLNEEKEKMVKMAAELASTHTKLQRLQTEKNKLVTSLSERQTNELQVRQECLSETQKLRGELDSLQRQIRASQIKQQAVERENHILQITVQQRDAEIERQQEIVEAIKDSVSQLLLELDTTKTGADKSYLTNSSFNLQKILHMLDKEHGISHNRSTCIRSDPGSARMDQSSHPRLTAEVLASHNEKVCRQRGIMGDDIRGSTSDTEVEFMEREENIRKKSPKMRRRSISTDGQHLHDFQKSGRMGYKPQAEFRQFGQFYPNENPDEMRGQRGKGQGHPAYRYDSFPNTLSQYENISDVEQSKVSAVESRYSVTDYFKKYNANKPSGALTGNRSVNKDRTHLRSVSFRDESRLDNVNHRRSLSQPESQDVRNFSTQRNIPAQESSNYRDTIGAKSKLKSPQEKLFTGTVLDNSISAIDDDNISSVSEKTLSRSTTSTFDDKSFRKGIATLDANILKLQLALQKTKSMLT